MIVLKNYDVAAYVWPAYTGDEPRTKMFWSEGYGEWQTVKSAEAKFPGHTWPRKPLWGYVNEADPHVMEMEIEAAVEHGVNVFIYDWYWYDKRPFLETCLNNGFLKARNRNKMKFYLMWANHNGSTFWDKRIADDGEIQIWDGAVDRTEFNKIVDRVINNYFVQENYYKIDGCPVFSIYYLHNLIRGLGGIDETAEAIGYFRQKTKEAGFPDLHLQLILLRGMSRYRANVPLYDYHFEMKDALEKMHFDSATHYQLLSVTDMNRDYAEIFDDVKKEWEAERGNTDFKYFPHVSCGWDNNPRTHKLMPMICTGNTPEQIEKMFSMAKEYIDKYDIDPPLVTVNSWNEWTETSYLQPDDINGYGYLEAIKKVFKNEKE